MQGEYSANPGVRPRLICTDAQGACGDDGGDDGDDGDDLPARLFLCAGCRTQALICSFCDRGQVYCAGDCAQRARRHTLRAAGQRYQNSHQGRRAHAARTARWRMHQKNVTHHGSPQPAAHDVLSPSSPKDASDAASRGDTPRRATAHCHWCGRLRPGFVRQGFLRRRSHRRRAQPRTRGI